MRTIRTKVYQFSELSEQAKQKALINFIPVIIETLQEPEKSFSCPYWDAAVEMEKMHTPWFLGETIYHDLREYLIADIEANEYEFKADGTRF